MRQADAVRQKPIDLSDKPKGLSKADWFRLCRIFRSDLTEAEIQERYAAHLAKLAGQGA
jgi:hypothetical protein